MQDLAALQVHPPIYFRCQLDELGVGRGLDCELFFSDGTERTLQP